MLTEILQPTDIDQAVALLKAGEVVALPTETVYGLAADATNEQALEKIFAAKGRPLNHPLIVHIDSMDKAESWATDIPQSAKLLANHFWPGPLTMILNKRASVSEIITGGQETIGLRMPKHPITLEIIKRLGSGIAAPSANAHKKISPTTAEHVLKTLGGKIAAVIDGGACSVGVESTIIDMTKPVPVILRPGAITPSMIEEVIGGKVDFPQQHTFQVAGNMEDHYQPEKPLFVFSKDTLPQEENTAVVHYSELEEAEGITYYKMPLDKKGYARNLYKVLYEIDQTGVDKIFVEQPPAMPEWADVIDRLQKAMSK